MNAYYVSKFQNEDGRHEVHAAGCKKVSGTQNYIYLGKFSHSSYALEAAKKRISTAVECADCSSKLD